MSRKSSDNGISNSDKDIIIRLGIEAFNKQYNTDYDREDMDCYSIPTSFNKIYAYEIFTNTTDDEFRIRMYLSLDGSETGVGSFKLKVADVTELTGSGSSVYVATGTMDRHYVWSDTFSLQPLEISEANDTLYSLMSENDGALYTESGESLLLEAA